MTPEERAEYVKRICPLSEPEVALEEQKRLKRSLKFLTSMHSENVLVPLDTLKLLEAYIWLLETEIYDLVK